METAENLHHAAEECLGPKVTVQQVHFGQDQTSPIPVGPHLVWNNPKLNNRLQP